jgi:acyl-CoA reductase-like NAD-dependent aldehyde dehydrogenase
VIDATLNEEDLNMLEGKMLIDGAWRQGEKVFESINPATGDAIGQASIATDADISEVVTCARRAFIGWRKKSLAERGEVIQRAIGRFLAKREELANLITCEMGKPIKEADFEVSMTAEFLKFFAEEARALLGGETTPVDQSKFPNKLSYTQYEPIGVVASIKPWNMPLLLPACSVACALITGNTVVLKPSELTPFVGIEIGKAFEEAGVPPSVVNVVTGADEVGRKLVESAVDMVTFTGSVETGKSIMKESSPYLHRLCLELGGKDPFIVCEDADLELASNAAVWGAFSNCGQVCMSVERIYVVEKVISEFIRKVVEKTKLLTVGDGREESTVIGPLVSREQREKVENHVQDAVGKGARILCGGERPSDPRLQKGFFYMPTVLVDVDHSMKVMCEETFGPIAPIMVVKDEEEAVALANETPYGLAASIWTTSLSKAMSLSQCIQAGTIWVNEVMIVCPQFPFGGVKQSGIGREFSGHGLREYLNIKHVNMHYGTESSRPWWYSH